MYNYYIIHLCVFVAGLMLRFVPPKKINWIYGYRTNRSIKDESSFKFANRVSANLLMLFFVLTFAISVLVGQVFKTTNLFWLVFIGLALTIIITEIKLKKFQNDRP